LSNLVLLDIYGLPPSPNRFKSTDVPARPNSLLAIVLLLAPEITTYL